MTPTIIEAKRIDGKPAHRVAGSAKHEWIVAPSEIDAMLNRVKLQTGARRGEILEAIGVPPASISRCRKGHRPLQEYWILRLSDLSGIPVAELRQVACIKPEIAAHYHARRVA